MSTSEEDDKKVVTRVQPGVQAGQTTEVVMGSGQPMTAVVQAPPQTMQQSAPTVNSESIAKHTTTNMTALVGLAVGIVVLAGGLLLAFRITPDLPYPFSTLGFILIAVALIAIGASLVSNRTQDRPE